MTDLQSFLHGLDSTTDDQEDDIFDSLFDELEDAPDLDRLERLAESLDTLIRVLEEEGNE